MMGDHWSFVLDHNSFSPVKLYRFLAQPLGNGKKFLSTNSIWKKYDKGNG